MHQDPWEPSDGPFPADRKPDPEANKADAAHDDTSGAGQERAPVPSPLLNWRVLEQYVEIEGEATLIEETEVDTPRAESVAVSLPIPPAQTPAQHSPIRDHHDEVVVAGMPVRRAVVLPGEAATFEVTVANHGRWPALFEISVEGWIDEAWTPDLPARVQLEPGARQVVVVTVQPPRHAACRAGDHTLVVVVRAARYPGHVTRLAATLVIERLAGLKLGAPQPATVEVSWFSPAAKLRLPVTNQSNYAATILLQGVDRNRQSDFTFYTDGYSDGYTESNGGEHSLVDGILGSAQLKLQPGQSVVVPVEIRCRQRPLIGLLPRTTPFRLVARMETEPPLRRAVDGEVAMAALIGPWQLAAAAVLAVVAFFGTGIAGLALLVALRSASPTYTAPPAAATAAPAPPIVTFVIQMDQPMPTRAPGSVLPNQLAPQSAAPDAASAVPAIPVVSADQVTAPGEPTPVGQPPLRPVVVTTPDASTARGAAVTGPDTQSSTTMTYGQMFKEIASQFDLDWRLLAAQAYLESGFDSLALSGQGDMGLMQIRPGTWNDWAPTVAVSDPFDAYSNVLVGAAYLNYLREQLSARGLPEQQWMLVAYNWGPDKVFEHIDAGGTWETLEPARRQYADDVLRIAATIPPS